MRHEGRFHHGSRMAVAGGVSLAIAWAIVGCSSSKDMEIAEADVAHFHSELDAAHYDAIYAATGDDFKKVTSHDDFVGFLQDVHGKLGAVTSAGYEIHSIPEAH